MATPPPPGPKDDANLAQLALLMGYSGQSVDFTQLAASAFAIDMREKARVARRLNGFNIKDTIVWKVMTRRFGGNIKHPELVSMAEVLSSHACITLDRDAKRRKSVLVKWFQENWASIEPYLPYIVLEDGRVKR
jgi:hypothetical protein